MKNLIFTLFCFAILQTMSCQQAVEVASGSAGVDSYYTETHRPQFHFTPEKMWMNDPNGMVFFEGEYHLFYQHYPEANVWGPMHWGHAVSRDLVHWEHLPIALYPDSLGYIFSGSAVVDWNNTSGFGENGKPPLIAIFTQHLMEGEQSGRSDFQYQSIAYSNDRGRTWKLYEGNPVIPNTQKIRDFRDPKVIWDESSEQWVMVFAAHDHVMLWGSPDLKNWTHLSNFGKEYGTHGGVWECPDLFPMTVEGTGETKWVLLQSLNPGGPNGGSGTQYFVGNFDGKNFTLDPSFAPDVTGGKAVWLDWGRDNYAGVTWSDVPKEDGRRIFMGWMSNWDYATVVPTEAWRSAMTLPRSLILKNPANGYRLISQPVKELEALRGKVFSIENQPVTGEVDLTDKLGFSPRLSEIQLEIELPDGPAPEFGIALSNSKGEEYRIGFDAAKNEFYSDRTKAGDHSFSEKFAVKLHTAPRASNDKTLRLHLFFDVASCELFADGGEVVITEIFFPSEALGKVRVYSNGGELDIVSLKVFELGKSW
ncbi:MAG: glycoside hydrolase family 32 protein [Saprospiraceae bacterium]|nr:glycoside hydrolase family 32 protein [Saprospiraceae bacterium]